MSPPDERAPWPELPLKGFLETSFLDWPGRVSAVLFLGGCNFRCPYCHNPGLVENPAQLANLAWPKVRARLAAWRGWLDGVVVTGGEPALSPRLPELLAELKGLGFKIKLDTNGARPEVVANLIGRGLIDHLALDVKAPLNGEAYRRAAGRPEGAEAVRSLLGWLAKNSTPYTLRTTVTPGLHDRETIRAMARELRGHAPWVLQKFRPGDLLSPLYSALPAMSDQEFQALAALAKSEHGG